MGFAVEEIRRALEETAVLADRGWLVDVRDNLVAGAGDARARQAADRVRPLVVVPDGGDGWIGEASIDEASKSSELVVAEGMPPPARPRRLGAM